jgi:transketolase
MERILEISFKHNLSHIGSCLTVYPILEQIYSEKKEEDLVMLSSGHAGLAQYVIIEKHSNNTINAEDLLHKMGIHPSRDPENKIYVSSGSLGCGILVAVGLAIADKNRTIYCVLSDGECAEGSVWEALAFCKNQNIKNIKIHVNINGFSAYDAVDRNYLADRLKIFFPDINIHQTTNPEYLGGLNAHYHIMKNATEVDNIINANSS